MKTRPATTTKPKASDEVRKIDLDVVLIEPNGQALWEPVFDKAGKATGEQRDVTLGGVCYAVLTQQGESERPTLSDVVRQAKLAAVVAAGGQQALSAQQIALIITRLEAVRFPPVLKAAAYELLDPVAFDKAE